MRTALRIAAVFITCAPSFAAGDSSEAVIDLLSQVSAKLQSLTAVSYHSHHLLSYPSENYRNVLEGDVSVDFDAACLPIGARYQARDVSGFEIFNGSEILRGTTATHSLTMTAVHAASDLDRQSYLYNSLVTLRLALPKLIADPAIAKSIQGRDHNMYKIEIRVPQAVLNATGTLSPITLPRDILYQISIDDRTLLPAEVLQTNSQNSDRTLVVFSGLNTNPERPTADSWRYSSYRDYHLVMPGPSRTPLPVNIAAPAWTLPVAANGNPISLAEILAGEKTRLLLLEFWISHCGYSIDAVPKLNALARRFQSAGLVVAGIDPDDDEATIQLFATNHSPQFTLFAKGGKAADEYGVPGYPTVFLIGKNGKILYSGEFNPVALSLQIASLLPEIP